MELTKEMMEALARPFPAEAIQWKPAAVKGDRALALSFVDSRWYMDRLDEIVGPDWSDDYEVQPGGTVVLSRLTIAGVTRCDIGEAEPNDPNTATSALAQGFKRACSRFGLGRHLYRMPKIWAEYDQQRKCFADAALARLHGIVSSGNGAGDNGNGNVLIPAGPHAGKPLSWLVANDRSYLERIAAEAQDMELREAARMLLN